MRRMAAIDFSQQMRALNDELESASMFGKRREDMEWRRELDRNPNLTPEHS
jgi:hypothetical protein